MRISDWSSDVCSSDLLVGLVQHRDELADLGGEVGQDGGADRLDLAAVGLAAQAKLQIGEGLREAACRIGDALRILVVDLAHEGLQPQQQRHDIRSEEHTSELQSLMRISYAVFCLTKK